MFKKSVCYEDIYCKETRMVNSSLNEQKLDFFKKRKNEIYEENN